MIRRLRALWDPRLALLLVPIVAIVVLIATTGSGAESGVSRATAHATTTTVAASSASSQSPIAVPPSIPVDTPTVTAPDVGDNDPVATAARNRAATVRAARSAMGDPIPSSPNSTSGLVVGATGSTPTTDATATTLPGAVTTTVADPTSTTVAAPTTTADQAPGATGTGPDPVVSETGSPLLLLVVAFGAAAVAAFGLVTRRRPARNA